MWKVIIVVCTLGNPCLVMQEDPRYYNTKSECMANASVKHSQIVEAYPTYGYEVSNSDFTCEKVDGLTNS